MAAANQPTQTHVFHVSGGELLRQPETQEVPVRIMLDERPMATVSRQLVGREETTGLAPRISADTSHRPLWMDEPAVDDTSSMSLARGFQRDRAQDHFGVASPTEEIPLTDPRAYRSADTGEFGDWPPVGRSRIDDETSHSPRHVLGEGTHPWWQDAVNAKLDPEKAQAVEQIVLNREQASADAADDLQRGRELLAELDPAYADSKLKVDPTTLEYYSPEADGSAPISRADRIAREQAEAILNGPDSRIAAWWQRTKERFSRSPKPAEAVGSMAVGRLVETQESRYPRAMKVSKYALAASVAIVGIAGPTLVALDTISDSGRSTTKIEAGAIPGGAQSSSPDVDSQRPAAPDTGAAETTSDEVVVVKAHIDPYSSSKTDAAGFHLGTGWDAAWQLNKQLAHGGDVSNADIARLANQIGQVEPGVHSYQLKKDKKGVYNLVRGNKTK